MNYVRTVVPTAPSSAKTDSFGSKKSNYQIFNIRTETASFALYVIGHNMKYKGEG